jgi:antibiotic biosynthesis monooxygenase (ABM) superfamily enzyme
MSASPVFLATAKVRFGQEALFSAWQTRHNRAIADFPGFQSSDVIPGGAVGSNEWTIIVNFQTPDQLRVWQHSRERAELVEESAIFLDDANTRRSARNGDLSLSGGSRIQATGRAPSNWKVALLLLLPLYPIVVLEGMFLSPLLESLHLPSAAAAFVGLAFAVLLSGLISLPLLARAFKWWLVSNPGTSATCLKGIAVLCLLYAIEVAIFWRLMI